jgi:acid stress-induced BolA-like protein IbaG/YrbA
VNGIIAEELKSIHAFTQKTMTPAEWEKKKAEAGAKE